MSVVSSPPLHPSVAAVARAREALSEAGERDPIYLSPAEHGALLRELVALNSQVAELQARVTIAAGPAGVDDDSGAHDVTAWIAGGLGVGHSQARAATRFAERLDRSASVAEAMREGTITVPQADVVTRALDALPTDLDPTIVLQAELQLVDLASAHDARELRVLGRRILEVVAPEIAEALEARALQDEERTAWEKTRLTARRRGDGTSSATVVAPDLTITRLLNYLHAFTNPRKHHDGADGADGADPNDDDVWRKLSYPRKLGQAFCQLMERIDPKTLPDHGSTSTELIVTMTLESLRTELATATVLGPEGASLISASEARRLACNAGIIPAVLGSKGEVLDLGRSARLGSRAQKRALMVAHATCQGEHCDTPAAWCEMHHLKPWESGGKTDLKDMALVCNHDHQRLHDARYTHELLPHGKIRFTRRC